MNENPKYQPPTLNPHSGKIASILIVALMLIDSMLPIIASNIIAQVLTDMPFADSSDVVHPTNWIGKALIVYAGITAVLFAMSRAPKLRELGNYMLSKHILYGGAWLFIWYMLSEGDIYARGA